MVHFPRLIISGSLSGEILGLLGPNGAGKSSSIRMISGIAKPTAGEVVKNGRMIFLFPNYKFRDKCRLYLRETLFLAASMIF